MEQAVKPTPQITDLSQPYWEAAAQGRIILQTCAACGKIRHYPQLLCSTCYSDKVTWTEASGKGKVHSWTVSHHAFHPAFAAELPYTLVTVDLEEGVRALGLWQGKAPLALEQRVVGHFEPRNGDGVNLVFKPDQAN